MGKTDRPSRLVLFDIDLTLLNLPADRAVLRKVIASLAGEDADVVGVDPTGRSDWWVVNQISASLCCEPESLLPRYAATYAELLGVALDEQPGFPFPGVQRLLTALAADSDVCMGIATGNLRANAGAKLNWAGLSTFFDPLRGDFGDGHLARAEIVAAAIAECSGERPASAYFVADTVLDMQAAVEVGITPIGVATGRYSVAELKDAGAAVALPDLGHTTALLELLLP